MSFLNKVFGWKKGDKPPSVSEAIQQLRETEDLLMKKQEYLEKKVETEQAVAKKNVSTNRRVAVQALKRKKRYEKQLQQLDGILATIEMQRETLEGANTNSSVVQAMKVSADALKGANESMDIDKVYDMMDVISDQHGLISEVSDIISTPLPSQADIDEDELEKELEELEQEELDKELLGTKTQHDQLPAVPNTPLPSTTKSKQPVSEEDDDVIKELQQWAM